MTDVLYRHIILTFNRQSAKNLLTNGRKSADSRYSSPLLPIKSDKERGVVKSSLFFSLNSAQTALARLNASQISVMPTKLGGPHMQGLRNRENLVTPLFPVKLFGSALYVRNKG